MKNNYDKLINHYCDIVSEASKFDFELYNKYNVKRGLRNSDSTGVLVGLTKIGDVQGYKKEDGVKTAIEGKLFYRGVDVEDIVRNCQKEGRFSFEESAYLLLFGSLPTTEQLKDFTDLLAEFRTLPIGFTEDMILKAPSRDIMVKLARSVLACYSYDDDANDTSIKNLIRQSIELVARFCVFAAYGYQALAHYYKSESLHIHNPRKDMSTAENILYMLRMDNQFTKLEAEVLDLSLTLHAEHGGGNNSTFTVRVVSSTNTDIYSSIAAGVGSLKGPKHGGANIQVLGMVNDLKANVENPYSKEQIKEYLIKVLKKEAYDKKGLVYGMGHAVYTVSDPRAILLKEKAYELAKEKNMLDEFIIYSTIEELTPVLFKELKGSDKAICANVDLYSGFVYSMLEIPGEMFTPLFAVSRITGWCAHLIEEHIGVQRIMRPAYKNILEHKEYTEINDR